MTSTPSLSSTSSSPQLEMPLSSSSSSYYLWLQVKGKEWLIRIVATLALAVLWHVLINWWWRAGRRGQQSITTTTETRTNSIPTDDHDKSCRDAAMKRQTFLDQLQQSSNNKNMETNKKQKQQQPPEPQHENQQQQNQQQQQQDPDDVASEENNVDCSHALKTDPTLTQQPVAVTTATTTTTTPPTLEAPLQSSKSSRSTTTQTRNSPSSTTTATSEQTTIPFRNTSPHHPGLAASGFHHWYDVETSLYRIYRIGRTDGVDVIPPYMPQSRRGNVQVYVQVTNDMHCTIEAFWVDFQGREVSKGKFRHGTTWSQTTWIEHPWVFRTCPSVDDSLQQQQQLLLHYIPYRVIPTTIDVPTTSPDDPHVGMHQFTLTTNYDSNESYWACQVEDPVMPHPASRHFQNHNTSLAIEWVLQHMIRTNYDIQYSLEKILLKYWMNIVQYPDQAKYRQWRIATKLFQTHVWNTSARGLWFCLGAVEQGAYCEMGLDTRPLRPERVQDVSKLIRKLKKWKQQQQQQEQHQQLQQQPEGAVDGYGRAGYGRAGQIN